MINTFILRYSPNLDAESKFQHIEIGLLKASF